MSSSVFRYSETSKRVVFLFFMVDHRFEYCHEILVIYLPHPPKLHCFRQLLHNALIGTAYIPAPNGNRCSPSYRTTPEWNPFPTISLNRRSPRKSRSVTVLAALTSTPANRRPSCWITKSTS